MAETSNQGKPHLFDMCFQFPEDEFDWELDRNYPSECWDLFNSWLECPEDEFALFGYEDEPDEETLGSNMAGDDGLSA